MLVDKNAIPCLAGFCASCIAIFFATIFLQKRVAIRNENSFWFEFRIADQPQLARIFFGRTGDQILVQLRSLLREPNLALQNEICRSRRIFRQKFQMRSLCRVNRSFVQDNRVRPKVNSERGIFPKKSFCDFPGLPDQISIVFRKLLVLAWIVANHNQADFVITRNFVKRTIIYDWRFHRIRRRVFLRSARLQRNKFIGKRAPFIAFFLYSLRKFSIAENCDSVIKIF